MPIILHGLVEVAPRFFMFAESLLCASDTHDTTNTKRQLTDIYTGATSVRTEINFE